MQECAPCDASADAKPGVIAIVIKRAPNDDRDIADQTVIADVLGRLGQPAPVWLERAQSSESKDRLRRNTAEAQRLGIFGAPTFAAGGELFWGNDRLEDALEWCVT